MLFFKQDKHEPNNAFAPKTTNEQLQSTYETTTALHQ